MYTHKSRIADISKTVPDLVLFLNFIVTLRTTFKYRASNFQKECSNNKQCISRQDAATYVR